MISRTSPVAHAQVAVRTSTDHMLGPESAPITLIEYGNYQCAECGRAESKVRRLLATYRQQLRLVFRHLPIVQLYPHAELAAEAAEAAAAQGKFWAMHRQLFSWPHRFRLTDLIKNAQVIGLDMTRFHAEMADRIHIQKVHEHRRVAELNDLHTTPTFILNGKQLDVSQGINMLEEAVHALRSTHATKSLERQT